VSDLRRVQVQFSPPIHRATGEKCSGSSGLVAPEPKLNHDPGN
jgi:hypothetical protein